MMMTRRHIGLALGMATAVALTAGALIASARPANADIVTNETAPAFTGQTSAGETISLEDFAGKTVVLEWTNHGCPFVQKHYDQSFQNMQGLQADAASDEIVWLSVISSAPGKQGHVTPEEANDLTTSRGATPAAIILDESGDLGRLYGAKTTPHMYVITGDGTLVYQGAIDSIKSASTSDIPDAENYVTAALDALATGAPVETAQTRPYGCSVKY
ncbi:MAG: redoxin domain-containing protein [Pseudomonadota bacterium]